jgi:hypothetical protein
LLMGQIRATGLPLPSVDRVARIIRSATQDKEGRSQARIANGPFAQQKA